MSNKIIRHTMRSHPSTFRSTHHLAAAAFALLIYGALFLGFDYAPSTPDASAATSLADVTFLPLSKTPEFAWQKKLIASLELLDPTVLSLPNPKHGFSRVREFEFARPDEPIPDHVFAIALIQHSLFPTITLAYPPVPILEATTRAYIQELDPISTARADYPVFPATMYWTDDRGEVISPIPVIPNEAIAVWGDEIVTSGSSQFAVVGHQELTRIRLVASCGHASLDRLALAHLERFYARLRYLSPPEDSKANALTAPQNAVVQAHWWMSPCVRATTDVIFDRIPYYDPDWF